jgi:hypothetical protein
MYGFSGYGASAYGSERQTQAFIIQVVKFGARIFSGLYPQALTLARADTARTIMSVYGKALTLLRFNSARTFSDPQNQSQTMKLPA